MKHHYDLDVFYKKNELSYYLLGAFCTDGNIKLATRNRGSAKIDSKDEDWLRQIAPIVCKTTTVRPDKRSECFKIEFYSIEMVRWLIQHGCTPKKSLTLQFPTILKQYLPDFIRGCWDGDGSLGMYRRFRKDRNCYETCLLCRLYTGSKVFAEAMQSNLSQLSIKSVVRPRTAPIRKIGKRTITLCNESYYVDIQDKQSIYNFCKTVYYDGNPLAMPRKLALSISLLEECSSILNKTTSDQITQIFALVKTGLTYRQIGEKFGFTKNKVAKIVINNR